MIYLLENITKQENTRSYTKTDYLERFENVWNWV